MRPRKVTCGTCGSVIVERRGRRFCLACSNRKSALRAYNARSVRGARTRQVCIADARQRLSAYLRSDEPAIIAALADLWRAEVRHAA